MPKLVIIDRLEKAKPGSLVNTESENWQYSKHEEKIRDFATSMSGFRRHAKSRD